jgi:hypothetical protein
MLIESTGLGVTELGFNHVSDPPGCVTLESYFHSLVLSIIYILNDYDSTQENYFYAA